MIYSVQIAVYPVQIHIYSQNQLWQIGESSFQKQLKIQ